MWKCLWNNDVDDVAVVEETACGADEVGVNN